MYEEMFHFTKFYLPRRIMDPYSIYVEVFPRHTAYNDLKDTLCPFQRSPPLAITKKEHYAIITFQTSKTVRKIMKKKDLLTVKGKTITIKEACNRVKPSYIYLPPSFRLPPTSLFLPFFIPIAPPPPPLPQSSPPPPLPSSPHIHPFPEGFSYFFYK